MTCWRCGSTVDEYDGRLLHKAWCRDGTPNDCTHCGGNPCRWWCLGADDTRLEPAWFDSGRVLVRGRKP
jgi:hypothetical protein